MKKESECCGDCKNVIVKNKCHHHGSPDSIYGLGVVGSLFYFLQGASGFTAVMWAIGKAIFWPAILIFKLLSLLNI